MEAVEKKSELYGSVKDSISMPTKASIQKSNKEKTNIPVTVKPTSVKTDL